MRMLGVVLVLTGVRVALPIFAMPPCSHCNTDIMQCEQDPVPPPTGIVCRPLDCSERSQSCFASNSTQLAQDMTIASVEVVTPQRHTVTSNAKTVRVAAARMR